MASGVAGDFDRAELRDAVMADDDVLNHIDQLLGNPLAQDLLGFLDLVFEPHGRLDDMPDELPAVGIAERARRSSAPRSWRCRAGICR